MLNEYTHACSIITAITQIISLQNAVQQTVSENY